MSRVTPPNRRVFVFGLPAFGVLAFGGIGRANAAIDARTVDPMNLQLVDWLHLGSSDRDIFLKGFSVGWHRKVDANSEDIRRGTISKLLDALDLQFTKLANEPTTAHMPLAAVLARAALIGWLPPIEMLGTEWTRLEMRHRILVLQTVVAGAYSEEIWRALGEPEDSDTLARALANPRRFARSPLPLNPNLMLTRLIDFYAEEEQLETPLAAAILSVDRRTNGAARTRGTTP